MALASESHDAAGIITCNAWMKSQRVETGWQRRQEELRGQTPTQAGAGDIYLEQETFKQVLGGFEGLDQATQRSCHGGTTLSKELWQ